MSSYPELRVNDFNSNILNEQFQDYPDIDSETYQTLCDLKKQFGSAQHADIAHLFDSPLTALSSGLESFPPSRVNTPFQEEIQENAAAAGVHVYEGDVSNSHTAAVAPNPVPNEYVNVNVILFHLAQRNYCFTAAISSPTMSLGLLLFLSLSH